MKRLGMIGSLATAASIFAASEGASQENIEQRTDETRQSAEPLLEGNFDAYIKALPPEKQGQIAADIISQITRNSKPSIRAYFESKVPVQSKQMEVMKAVYGDETTNPIFQKMENGEDISQKEYDALLAKIQYTSQLNTSQKVAVVLGVLVSAAVLSSVLALLFREIFRTRDVPEEYRPNSLKVISTDF